ncbi:MULTISPECIES: metalloregulator ArsR/SmtB family transcription factor [Gudongella]|jgi:ArsR family transcriptional regulator|uniref:ArsR/SmtB family transcription factor n=1 Tax=Gudongella oleilytica TaxID=1582259 RepID=UPI002A3617C3|nr:metalloregulator ArsR/SmtB family transcription factor [Gudongella oleilytica]MDY0257393.1 metalloregulator ArsR/SmtB family transcription factor [Gudongella oleilytica]
MVDNYNRRAKIFKALGDPRRIMILEMLQNGELCACMILERFDMAQSTLSHHMKLLQESGFVKGRSEGKWVHYSLDPEGFRVAMKIITGLSSTKNKLKRIGE